MQNFELQEIINKIYQNPSAMKLIKKLNYTSIDVEKNIMPFLALLASSQKCQNCQSIEDCKQTQKGKKVALQAIGNHLDAYFESCDKLAEIENNKSNLYARGYNIDLVKSQKLDITEERQLIISKITKIITDVENNIPTKGLYIYGSHGVGKTHILEYLASQLASSKKKIIFEYFPNLVRKIKSSINNNKLEDIMDELKEVDILILDDFGAESSSNFVRDEILGPILQERMNNNLLTFMSSNLDDDQLMEHLSETGSNIERVRATRIRSRMMALMEFVKLTGENRRN